MGDLLEEWARELGLSADDRTRWRAAGVLHDALKDAPEGELAELAGSGWPGPVVHAPACAERLAADGVDDRSLLDAIRYHPVGHPDLDELGEFLILADYLEPGRKATVGKRARMRRRLPGDRREVLRIVVRRRFDRLLDRNRPLMIVSVEFWNRMVNP